MAAAGDLTGSIATTDVDVFNSSNTSSGRTINVDNPDSPSLIHGDFHVPPAVSP